MNRFVYTTPLIAVITTRKIRFWRPNPSPFLFGVRIIGDWTVSLQQRQQQAPIPSLKVARCRENSALSTEGKAFLHYVLCQKIDVHYRFNFLSLDTIFKVLV